MACTSPALFDKKTNEASIECFLPHEGIKPNQIIIKLKVN
jgi:hypothetical protein